MCGQLRALAVTGAMASSWGCLAELPEMDHSTDRSEPPAESEVSETLSGLQGVNLQGVNLQGVNLGTSTLNGSTSAGTNLAGNSVVGTNLNATQLAGTSTGRNIHNLSGSINGMLYSAEDMWAPKTGQCIVMGLGSTAFAKLLGQQTLNAKISVALGRLPWSFSDIAGAPWRAWEAVVWGDKTYCVFVMAAPNDASWPGVAGFVKSVFRWNAPPTQKVEISGIEASAGNDPTLRTAIDLSLIHI